jgi:hypothetical protein
VEVVGGTPTTAKKNNKIGAVVKSMIGYLVVGVASLKHQQRHCGQKSMAG